ncbi:MAG: acetate--CoA ligase family protein [Deltaproteobacteria bacterium]|nr:acetate--CoA ligase family protein [Deltaproteobacteria bacterium]
MDFFFEPRGVAVIGATPNPLKGGNAILKNLLLGYWGGIYPVNPRYREIDGLPCYPSVSAVPGPVDLAIVFVPAPLVPAAVEECAAKGIPGVMVESGGFAEAGPEGAKLQRALTGIAAATGIRIWGPNCMGLVDVVHSHVFSFMDPQAQQRGFIPGAVSLVVQSGMLSAIFLIDLMSNATMGVSKVCSVGNKVDINECDLLEYFMGDPDTRVIGLYLESFPDGRRFLEICRRCEKPIVVLKGGRSRKGAEAAMSHTASLAGNSRIIAGALAQAGVVEANDFKQMMDLCRSLAMTAPPAGRKDRVAILTFSGGAGIVSTDFIEGQGLSLADLTETTRTELKKLFPDWMPVADPVDLWPAMESHIGTGVDVYSRALAAVLGDPGVNAVFLHTFAGNSRVRLDLADLAYRIQSSGKPVVVWQIGRREEAFAFQKEALSFGIPVFAEIGRAAECLAAVLHERHRPEPIPESGILQQDLPVSLTNLLAAASGPLDEHLSKEFLRACGIPTVAERIVTGAEKVEAAAAAIGYPVVLKGLLPGGVHKTEMGLVRLDIQDGPAALRAFAALTERMEGRGRVLLQRQIPGKVELILGLLRDPQFGTCVMFGLGGVTAELFGDAVFAVAPLTRRDALGLIGRIRGQKMLDGFRGAPPVDREEIARIIVRLGEIGLAFPRIREIDINPLICGEEGAMAVDATIILE